MTRNSRRKKPTADTIDASIATAKEEVTKAKERYDAAVKKLHDLEEAKKTLQLEELLTEMSKNDKTYEEVLEYIKAKPQSTPTTTNAGNPTR